MRAIMPTKEEKKKLKLPTLSFFDVNIRLEFNPDVISDKLEGAQNLVSENSSDSRTDFIDW